MAAPSYTAGYVQEIEAELKQLRAMRAALVDLRQGDDPVLDCGCHRAWTRSIDDVLAIAPEPPAVPERAQPGESACIGCGAPLEPCKCHPGCPGWRCSAQCDEIDHVAPASEASAR